MWQRFTERARRVVFFAQEEAARLGENYVGTEHLLLGLLREQDGVAARVLMNWGVQLESARGEMLNLLGVPVESDTSPAAARAVAPVAVAGPACTDPSCGHVNEPLARFCSRCGRCLDTGAERGIDAEAAAPPAGPFPVSLKVISALILGFLAGSIAFWALTRM